MDVANYIVWYVNSSTGGEVTPLKLQKLLYYVAASYFKESGSRLFTENIEKWKYGPVVPSVYHGFKSCGIEHIAQPLSTLEKDETSVLGYKRKSFSERVFILNKSLVNLIDPVIENLVSKDAFELVEITHREAAWKKLESQILQGAQELYYSDLDLSNADFNTK